MINKFNSNSLFYTFVYLNHCYHCYHFINISLSFFFIVKYIIRCNQEICIQKEMKN